MYVYDHLSKQNIIIKKHVMKNKMAFHENKM